MGNALNSGEDYGLNWSFRGHTKSAMTKYRKGPQRSITKDCKVPLWTAKNCIGF